MKSLKKSPVIRIVSVFLALVLLAGLPVSTFAAESTPEETGSEVTEGAPPADEAPAEAQPEPGEDDPPPEGTPPAEDSAPPEDEPADAGPAETQPAAEDGEADAEPDTPEMVAAGGGSGTFLLPIDAPAGDSTAIASAADLRKIGKDLPLNRKYHLTADIDLGGSEWVPIGSGSDYFTGTLDGQGHVIKNMTITGEKDLAGLIGQTLRTHGGTEKVVLKNIGLEDVNINITGGGVIGALLANNARGHVTISNCYVTGSIKGTGNSVYAGGLVGTSIGYNPGGNLKINDCQSAADITVTGTTYDGILEYTPITTMGKAFAGGIVGRAHDAERITGCRNTGTITTSSTGVSMAGGIIAIQANGTISECSNTAAVSATSSFATNDSDNMFTTKFVNAAGILAYNTLDNNMTTITGCYNTGNISATLTTAKTDKTDVFAGGIGGRTHKQTVSDCYNTGTVYASNGDGSLGYSGGIVGRSASGSYVQRCYSTGAISGAGPGGIVGLAMEGSNTRAAYWLAGTAPAGVGGGTGATTSRSAAEMKTETAFSGFGFVQTWAFKGGENSGYPVLRAFHPGLVYNPSATVPGPSREFLAAIEPPNEEAQPIGSLEELLKIGAVNGFPLHFDYVLTTNIDLTGIDWTPIGTQESPFTGSFDGQGYVLRNLSVTGQRSHAGLFGYVGGLGTTPVIKNLGLENVLINTTAPSLSATAGGLVGDFFRTSPTISNCYVTGSITATGQTAIAAGLIGYSDSSGGNMIVSDCYNGANVSAIYEKSNGSGGTHAGGIIGVAYNAKTINNCHNTGEITVTAVDISSAAGIAASLPYNNKLISNCSNTGKVSASTKGGTVIGAAGIVGRYDGSLNTDMSHIVNCWNTGDISVYLDSSSITTDVFAGGIGGRTHQNAVNDCYNTGNISATSNGHLNGTAGGIVGRSSTESSVRRCYSTGNVTASQNPGAIVGLAVEGSFAWACYWNSDATYTQDTRVLALADKKGVGNGEDTTTRRTAAQLKQEASYDHFFSFVKTWGFMDGKNSGYPVLRVAYPSLPYVSTVAAPEPQRNFTVPKAEIDPPAPDSIPISTREELDDIRNNMAGKFHLTADIDLSGVDWEPIGGYTHGNSNEPFTGVLDGQGHVIIGLTTQAFAISTSNRFGGLFAYAAERAVIKNLGMEDICLYTTGWNCWSGALCAATGDSVQVINCYATGQATVGSAKSTYGACIGGLVGYVTSGSLEAIDCHSSVTLTAISDDALNAGGICGIMKSGRLYNCYNTGSITANRLASASAGHPSAGGITGSITGAGELVQCSNTGKVYLSNGNSYGYAGGIVGRTDTTSKVSRSFNTGDVFLTSTTAGPTLDAGGVVGYNAGKVSDCYSLADVETEIKSSANATEVFSGGVAGSNAYRGAELARCYSSGSVSGSNPGGVAGVTVAGTTITECYWNKDMPHHVNGNVMNGRGIFTNGGTGAATTLTTTSMKQAASFTGFDFAGVWQISASQNSGYPALRQKPTPYTVTMAKSSSSTYPGTVTGGGDYARGETVAITAGASTSTSYRFKEWTASSDAVVFANNKSASTTFTMVAGHVTITAVYEAIPTPTAKVQGVGSGGTSSVKCKVGSPATIKAGTLAGKQFRQWVANGSDIVFADPYGATTTFIMPERNDIVVEALWDDVYYTITVDGGTASVETALMGTVITITANPPEPGKQGNFTRWTASPSVTFAGNTASQTTFTMPASNIVVTANYAAFIKGTQSAPSTPILASASGTTVTLKEIPGAEYRRGSNAWQDSPVFTDLVPGTRYGFSARMKATDLLKESYSSSTLYVTIPKAGVLLGADATEAEKAAADLTALTVEIITDGSTDDDGAVIKKITLPTTGVNGSKITWASSDPERLNPASGAVSRPAYGEEDARVTLTATVTCGSATETAALALTIKALDTPAVLTGVAVTPTTSEIQVGDTLMLTAGPLPAEASLPADVTWRVSSGSSYASVDENGLVTGLKAGTAKVRATAGGFTSVAVTVKVTDKPDEPDLPELKSVRISPATARIPLNGKKSFTVLGNTGAEAALKESDIAWTIENAEPADLLTIDGASDAEKVTIRASESVAGKAILRVNVTAKDGATFNAECEVTVYPVITGLSLDKTALRLMPASTTDLVATVTPATAEARLHWASSNPQVVAVKPAADGSAATLTATGAGTAMVSVSTEGFLARCAVTVRWNAGTLVLDKEYLLLEAGADDATLTATATAADAAYPLGTPTDLAVVDAAGKTSDILELTPRDDGSFAVTPKKKGTAFVKFTVPNNPGLVATCRVDVYTLDPRADFAQRRVHPAAFTLYTRQLDPEWRLPLVLEGGGNPWRLNDASYAFTGNAADVDALSRALDIEPHEDGRSLKLVPTDAFRSLAAKKYSKIGIAVTLPENTGGRALIPDTFTLTVSDGLPKLAATPLTIESTGSVEDRTAAIEITGLEGLTPDDYTLAESGANAAINKWASFDRDEQTVTVDAGTPKKSGSYKLTVDLTGWRGNARVEVSLKVNSTCNIPALKLSKTKVTVYETVASTSGAPMQLLPKTGGDTLAGLGIEDIEVIGRADLATDAERNTYKLQDKYEVEEGSFNLADGSFTLRATSAAGSSHPSGKVLLGARVAGSDWLVRLPVTVGVLKAGSAVKLAASQKTITLNQLLELPQEYTFRLTTNVPGYNVDWDWADTDSVTYTLKRGSANVTGSDELDLEFDEDGAVTVRTTDSTEANASYKLAITKKNLYRQGGPKNGSITLTIKTVKTTARVGVKLAASGKTDLTTGSTALVTAQLTNYMGGYTAEPDFIITPPRGAPAWAEENLTLAPVDDSGTRWRLEPVAGAQVWPGTYKVEIIGGGTLPGVPDYGLPDSKAVKVTVSATKPAVTQSVKKVTLYPADAGSSATVRLELPAGTPDIEDVKLKGAAGSCYAVDYHGGIATISLNQAGYDAARVKSQTLTLEVYLAGNAKAATTIKVGVTAQKFK